MLLLKLNCFFQSVRKSLRGNPEATGTAVVSGLLFAATEGGCCSNSGTLILHSAKGGNGITQIYWVRGSVFQCADLIRAFFPPQELLLLYRPNQSFHKEGPINYKLLSIFWSSLVLNLLTWAIFSFYCSNNCTIWIFACSWSMQGHSQLTMSAHNAPHCHSTYPELWVQLTASAQLPHFHIWN